MSNFTNLGRTLTAAFCAILVSTTMVLGAVGPAQAGDATRIVRAIA